MRHTTPFGTDYRRDDTDLQHTSLGDLARFCAHELLVFTQGGVPNDLYPGELLRRAVVLRDSVAWCCIYQQYAPFVLPYLLHHPQARTLLEQKEPAALVDAVLSTFASNLNEEKLAHLNSLTLLLKYLKVCVHSTIADAQREAELTPLLVKHDGEPPMGATADQLVDTQNLWQMLVGELSGEDERLLFTLLFVRGFSAHEVCAQEPSRFPDSQAVYRMKAQVFERLRTSECLQALLCPQ